MITGSLGQVFGSLIPPKLKPVPHPHFCPGCNNEWLCYNEHCLDIEARWCRKWCSTPPEDLRPIMELEEAGHRLHHEQFFLETRLGEKGLAEQVGQIRERILGRVQEMYQVVKMRGRRDPA